MLFSSANSSTSSFSSPSAFSQISSASLTKTALVGAGPVELVSASVPPLLVLSPLPPQPASDARDRQDGDEQQR